MPEKYLPSGLPFPESTKDKFLAIIAGEKDIPMPQPKTDREYYLATIAEKNDPFIIHLTPTQEDYSGTSDKTCAEITEAYDAGRPIFFNIDVAAQGFTELTVPATQFTRADHLDGRVCAQCYVFNLPDIFIWIGTLDNADGAMGYATRVFTLNSAT